MMAKDYDVYELNTAEEIDAAFAKTFFMGRCSWAQSFDQDAVTDFLEALRGERTLSWWRIEWRKTRGASRFEAQVSSEHNYYRARVKHSAGTWGWGFSDFACHAVMKAAIEWDQRRREQKREAVAAKRAALSQAQED
jgi:hypothetical protein